MSNLQFADLPSWPHPVRPIYFFTTASGQVLWGLDSGFCQVWDNVSDATLAKLPTNYNPHVLGSRRNAPLICMLYRHRPLDLRVGSPLACPDADLGPESMLACMRAFDRPARLGGYRKLSKYDVASYQLALAEHRLCGWEAALPLHPAWPGVSFVVGYSQQHMASLLAAILDPKWYIEPTQTENQKKLYSYLGLVPSASSGYANMEAILGHTKSRGRNFERAQLVVDAWCPRRTWNSDWTLSPAKLPGAYFHRYHDRGGGGSKGLLHASRRFVRFLCEVWQEELRYRRLQEGDRTQLEPAFVPDHFFAEFDESESVTATAYHSHLVDARRRQS